MNEQDWLACTDPRAMLECLRGTASDRKLLLFPVGCFRSLFPRTPWQPPAAALDLIERYADGKATLEDVRSAEPGCWLLGAIYYSDPYDYAVAGGIRYVNQVTHRAVARGIRYVNHPTLAVAILHDLFGNPFRPASLNLAWLAWNGGTVKRLAAAIYDDRAFERLPILADALEEAGCTDADILAHCRGPGPHVRGCWVVDLLLSKDR